MQLPLVFAVVITAIAGQQSTTLRVPGTPESAPTTLTGCLMPPGGTTSMPGSGGSSGTGPAGMNADAANSGAFFRLGLGKKHSAQTDVSYSLVGIDQTQLSQLARSRVEVHGVLLPPSQSNSDQAVNVTTGHKQATKAPRQFKVTAIRQVAGSCGGQ